jgi:hypothetical protein
MNDISDLSNTIVAKSDQLNADDLVGTDRVITVTGVKRGNADNPVVINYQGDDGRPFKPCKTVRRIIIAAWGEDGNQWIGKQMRLFCDPSVVYAGQAVGGIRVSALSDISRPLSVKLALTRGKKKEHIIEVLQPQEKPAYKDDGFAKVITSAKQKIGAGELTAEQIINKCQSTRSLTDEQRAAIRDIEKAASMDPNNLMDDGE